MDDRRFPAAPDYTNAAQISLWANLMWIFAVLWALGGLLPVLVAAAVLNRAISWLKTRRVA